MSDLPARPYEVPLDPKSARVRPAAAPALPSYPLASRSARLGAAITDAAIYLIGYGFGLYMRYRSDQEGGKELRYWAIAVLGAFAVTVVQWTLLARRGQTLGKMAMNIRIIRYDDDCNPGFLSAVVLRIWLPGIISAIPCLGQLFLLIDIVSIFSEERRCLHDWLAGTKVVDA